MPPDLTTTNVFLGIIAAVSLLEAVAVVGVIVTVFLIHRQVTHLISGIEQRHVAPAATRVNAILDDVKDVTSTVKQQASHLDQLLEWFANFGSRRQAREQTPSNKVM